ncbi:MAG: peptidoglycan-binding protein [Clostridia bacterium]|nr:peptidoglycan-binding protein [Clostridia bacterium]
MQRISMRMIALLLCALCLFSSAGAVTANGSLCYGDSGEAVTRLQTALKALGYRIGTIDGSYGAYTENAVRKFQKRNGLTVDGIAGESTQEKIYAQAEKKGTTVTASATAASQVTSADTYFGGDYATITTSSTKARIKLLQSALNTLGYACGSADGKYGSKTGDAVKALQKANGLTADGSAGKKTLQKIESLLSAGSSTAAVTTAAQVMPVATESAERTLKSGMSGDDVKEVQTMLKTIGLYTGNVDGDFGSGTEKAVKAFQKSQELTQDGVVGSQTLQKLQKAAQSGTSENTVPVSSSSAASSSASVSVGKIQLLHWFREVKPSLKSGQALLVYEPTTKISWNLKVYSLGRHADCEPLTKADTENMVKAFGGENTWNQKAVYVRLPDGQWTLASTHDMPHMSGTISDNGFNGHLCVHFLRDMDECEQNDPKYGVANQETIRAAWKALTGETVN